MLRRPAGRKEPHSIPNIPSNPVDQTLSDAGVNDLEMLTLRSDIAVIGARVEELLERSKGVESETVGSGRGKPWSNFAGGRPGEPGS